MEGIFTKMKQEYNIEWEMELKADNFLEGNKGKSEGKNERPKSCPLSGCLSVALAVFQENKSGCGRNLTGQLGFASACHLLPPSLCSWILSCTFEMYK